MTTLRTEAIVFDCDGTLLETESRWTLAEEAMCARRGVAFAPELKQLLLGTHLDRAGAHLAAWFGDDPEQAASLGQELLLSYRAAIDSHGVEPMPGAHELVSALAGTIPLAVASNTQLFDTQRVLERSSLPDVFDLVICAGGDVTPKPEPDVYLAACAVLGATPKRSIAIEDSPVGAAAARAAGMRVYGVPAHGTTVDADVVVSSLHHISPGDLIVMG